MRRAHRCYRVATKVRCRDILIWTSRCNEWHLPRPQLGRPPPPETSRLHLFPRNPFCQTTFWQYQSLTTHQLLPAMTDSSTCAQCNKTTQDLGRSPKPCAKCRRASYCDRDCQKAHWKQHKQVCRLGLLPSATAGTSSSSSPNPTAGSTATSTPQNLERQIPQPFHRLHEKKWLHDRPENDVFKLLIDTYRLRMEDSKSSYC